MEDIEVFKEKSIENFNWVYKIKRIIWFGLKLKWVTSEVADNIDELYLYIIIELYTMI